MYDQPLTIVVPNDPEESIPHTSVQFVHPNRCVLTNKKLLFIWNLMAIFVMGTMYVYSEHEVTLQLQSRYAEISIMERGGRDWDEFTEWYSGAADWLPNPEDDNETFSNNSHDTEQYNDRDMWGYDTKNYIFSSGNSRSVNHSSSTDDASAVPIEMFMHETSSIFIYRIKRIISVVSNIVLNTTTSRPTMNDVRRVLEGLALHYSGPMVESINSLLDGIRNAAILDDISGASVENLVSTVIP
jgi:hypothetical protein